MPRVAKGHALETLAADGLIIVRQGRADRQICSAISSALTLAYAAARRNRAIVVTGGVSVGAAVPNRHGMRLGT